ncbi:hypothetical protein LN42_06740 [Marinitoga sp. 1137]|uniref:glycosyltransferase n=1 Tax=Marinitoga sp. 1137 TaxID=1545835 RepID=UPI0009506215|nr:glycosyltransferase [Marinitoga sp. 1137]APT76110.1 hypothetical protein LN42_06740 [Marinitoga sp. 1137]
MKDLLIIGSTTSVFTNQLAEKLKSKQAFEKVDVLSFNKINKIQDTPFDNIYFFNDVNGYFYRFQKFIYFKRLFRNIHKYDIVNIHYLDKIIKFYWNDIKNTGKKIVISIWGSDFYKINNKERNSLKKIIYECDALTFANPIVANDFINYYGKNFLDKIYINKFGLYVLDIIKGYKHNSLKKDFFKEFFNIPKEKIVLTIGYSSSNNHQHLKILNNLKKLDPNFLDKFFFIFPMTYGDTQYRSEIEKILLNSNLNFRIFKDFMDYDEIAKLRLVSDIMINLPITDQLSGSMQEYIYAGNIVITGEWLPYNILWENGIKTINIKNIDEINDALIYAVENFDSLKSLYEKDNEKIYKISSWEYTIKDWIYMYNKLFNK